MAHSHAGRLLTLGASQRSTAQLYATYLLAGITRQYSARAMSQLRKMAVGMFQFLNFNCKNQAVVIKQLLPHSSSTDSTPRTAGVIAASGQRVAPAGCRQSGGTTGEA